MKLILSVLMITLLGACSSFKKNEKPKEVVSATPEAPTQKITHQSIEKLINDWPEASKAAAISMINKYGLPLEATASALTWNETGPFKRTIVHAEDVVHNFPTPHSDVIEQVIDYKVPLSKIDDLWQFDGSLVLDRTKGELAARNDKEEMNFLSLNLANQIIQGEMNVEEARIEYARSFGAFTMGNTNQYTNSLNFTPDSETADADIALRPQTRTEIQMQEIQEEAQETLEQGI